MKGRFGRISAAVLAMLVAITVVGSFAARAAVHSQENRLLNERANEVSLVLSTAITSLAQQFDVLGGVLHATNNSVSAFTTSSDGPVTQGAGKVTLALLRATPRGFLVVAANGSGLHTGDLINDRRTAALRSTLRSGDFVTTPVVGTGADRTVGFAVGPPVAPPGMVLYRDSALGVLGPPREAASAPFSELNVVLYDAATPATSQALVATGHSVPLRGEVKSVPVTIGGARLLLQVSPAHPLVGRLTAQAPWITLGGGLLVSVLVALAVEVETRRRRAAFDLYQGEHQLAEDLQRSLLPSLPTITGLDVGASYLPGSANQQVGGDWYDVFELEGGEIGMAIGDVVGHDITAAAVMSRVQTALRAYAFLGESPSAVLDRLDRLITTFSSDRLVTVFYGVLSAPDQHGARRLRYANAGHPPPLVQQPGVGAAELTGADSLLLGVGERAQDPRPEKSIGLLPGSQLVLFTDGLIEVPGESMTDLVDKLKATVSSLPVGPSPQRLCQLLIDTARGGARRDDVAVLIARVEAVPLATPAAPTRDPVTTSPLS